MKKLSINHIIAGCYWLIAILFSLLEPWGNIDTRDFSYMGWQKFWEYNFYIAFVLVSMIILGILIWRNKAKIKTLIWMSVVNTMFIVMVIFDLLHFFPDPVQPLPFLVAFIETITALLVFGIIIGSSKIIKY